MMKKSGWLLTASVLFIAIVALEGWPALRDMSSSREWRVVNGSPNGTSMNGLHVAIEEQIAAISAQKPERAAVLIRLRMAVTPAARDAWTDCRVSLHDGAGQVWMPLTSANTHDAVKFIAPDHHNFGVCTLYPRTEPAGDETIRADQLFLLPSDGLENLQLHVSGVGTRPHALSFAVKPNIRQLP